MQYVKKKNRRFSIFQSQSADGLHGSLELIDIAQAQFKSTSRQSPYLYLVRLLCAWAIAVMFLGEAPAVLVLTYPVLWLFWVARRVAVLWSRGLKVPDDENVLFAWRWKTHNISMAAAIVFTIWALALFPYGTAFSKGFIFMTILVGNITALFSLTHVRSSAIGSAFSSTFIYAVFFTWLGEPAYQWMAVFGFGVTALVFLIQSNTHRDFISLIVAGAELREKQRHLEQKQKETEQLSELNYRIANTDYRTGIANRRCFRETLKHELAAARKDGAGFALCVFDIGGLKSITEIYGLDAGEQVLTEIARRLSAMKSDDIFIGRVGGDEFGFFGRCDEEKFSRVKAAFEQLVNMPIETKQGTFRPNYSAGIAHVSDEVSCATDLFERADFALSQAKRNRNMSTVVFNQVLDAERIRKSKITKALQGTNLKNELSLAYQPIINTLTNKIVGVECLARWTSPQLGAVSPADFIPLAEQSGLINDISLHLFDQALTEAKNWPATLGLSFNLSASNLSSRGFILDFLRILKRHGFAPGRLSCEVTETSVMWDFQETMSALTLLKDSGIKLSLDDFGTGYSSLSHVHDLPLDCIKVDRQFVSGISVDTNGYRIVKSLLALSRDMDVSCVVEGVETEAELAVLNEIGCDQVQGYLFARPLEAEAFSEFLADGGGIARSEIPSYQAAAT